MEAMLSWLNHWLSVLRPLFETMYFIAAVVLTIVAVKGLEQLKIAKETAKTIAKREAFKLAADECRNFADRVIPLATVAQNETNNLNLPSFRNPQFRVVGGDITNHNFSDTQLLADMPKCAHNVIQFLNALEAFSVFFASGVADESVAYRETNQVFCPFVKKYMPAIWFLRSHNLGRFESTVRLYELWTAKMDSERLEKTRDSIDLSLKNLKRDPIKPIGTD